MRSLSKQAWTATAAALAIVALGAPACGDDDDSTPNDAGLDGSVDGGTTGGGTGGSGPLDAGTQDAGDAQVADAGMLADGEIIHVMLTANTGEIEAGQLAMSRAMASEVKAFANRMVTDHGGANDMLNSLSQNNPIPPIDNALSQQLRAASMKETRRLMKLTGARFDRAYMDAQVADHMHVLGIINTDLLTQVQDSMLRAMLLSMRTMVQNHLMMARTIVDDLDADGGAEDGGT